MIWSRSGRSPARLALLWAAAGLLSWAAASAGEIERRLEPGKAVERELRGGESHSYRIALAKGDLLRVRVDQRRIDVVLVFRDPTGRSLASIDFCKGAPERGSLVAETAGDYTVEVKARRPAAPPALYEIVCEELRPATEADRRRKAIEDSLYRAHDLQVEGSGASLREALKQYEAVAEAAAGAKHDDLQAAALAGAGWICFLFGDSAKGLGLLNQARVLYVIVGDRFGEGVVLNSLGATSWSTGQLAVARRFYEESLAIRREIRDPGGEAVALCNLGGVYSRARELDKAREAYSDSARLAHSVGDVYTEGAAENGLAVVYETLKDRVRAEESYRRALELRHADGDRRGEAETIRNIGILVASGGEYEKARAEFGRSIDLARAAGDTGGELQGLMALAQVQLQMGRPTDAIAAIRQRLPLLRQTGDRASEALSWMLIGSYYQSAGESRNAVEPFLRALELSRAVGNRYLETGLLASLGALYGEFLEEDRSYSRALEYFETALPIAQSLGNTDAEATLLSNIGRVHFNSGELDRALQFYQAAADCRDETGVSRGQYVTLDDIGEVHAELHDWERAATFYARALEASRKAGDVRWENTTRSHQASLRRHRGDLDGARSDIEAVVASVETARMRVLERSLQSSFFASFRRYYDLDVEILMRLHERQPDRGFDALAFEVSERARSRSFLDSLNEARWDPRDGADPASLEAERTLRARIFSEIQKLGQPLKDAKRAGVEGGAIDGLLEQYETVEASVRASNPRYGELTRPSIPTAKEISSGILDPATVLLEYYLGEERSFLWAIDTGGVSSFELPGRGRLEELTRQAYASLSAPPAGGAASPPALATLARVLIGPIAGQYPGKRLVIAPDGALAYLPFAALPALEPGGGRDEMLAARHEIVQIPSAAVLAVLRRETGNRPTPPGVLAVFADPVFSPEDVRLSAASRSRQLAAVSPPSDATRALADVMPGGESRLDRLPFTRREATAVLSLVPAGERKEALDFDASRQSVLAGDVPRFRYLHFATHGVLDAVHPELSGIVLSLVDREGRQQPGFLSSMEIFHLRLPVDMVVLSACRTALGKEIRGEGLVGLTRAFMYAGAPRIVASLWRVDDAATAELMRRFYEGMLGREKLVPAAALREAQLSIARQKRWSHPYYWSGFVLQGEWR